MILPVDIKPEKCLYVIGSQIIKLLDEERLHDFNATQLYEAYIEKHSQEISFTYFLFALDWLFIIDLIKMKNNTVLERCF